MLNHPIPSMNPSLQKVSEWRNSGNPNLIKKASTSVACIGIGATSLISSITKLALGIICFIPPLTFTFLAIKGLSLLGSSFSDLKIVKNSFTTAITSLFYKNVEFKKVGPYYFDDLL